MDCLPVGVPDGPENEIDLDEIAYIAASEGVDIAEEDIEPSDFDHDNKSGDSSGGKLINQSSSSSILADVSSKTGAKNKSEGLNDSN